MVKYLKKIFKWLFKINWRQVFDMIVTVVETVEKIEKGRTGKEKKEIALKEIMCWLENAFKLNPFVKLIARWAVSLAIDVIVFYLNGRDEWDAGETHNPAGQGA